MRPYRFTTAVGYLLNKVGARAAELFGRDLAEYDITVPMYRALAGLGEKGDQQLGELSEMITVDPSTLSRMLGELKRRGLVSRVRPENDERSIRLNLTAKGRALTSELMDIAARYESRYARGLGEEEMKTVIRGLNTIFGNLAQIKCEGSSIPSKGSSHRTPRTRASRGGTKG
jgi:DNA-binding MarR family transcriptional regulator